MKLFEFLSFSDAVSNSYHCPDIPYIRATPKFARYLKTKLFKCPLKIWTCGNVRYLPHFSILRFHKSKNNIQKLKNFFMRTINLVSYREGQDVL